MHQPNGNLMPCKVIPGVQDRGRNTGRFYIMEIWRDIPGYLGLYKISNLGNVRRYGRKQNLRCMERNGYFVVHLSNGNAKWFYVHRLVALAFIPNPDALPQINHKNECKTDNRVENLEWCTAHYNTNYGTRNKRIQRNRSFPVVQLDVNGKIVNVFYGISEAQRITGIDRPNICKCLKGKTKTAGGYKWKYAI